MEYIIIGILVYLLLKIIFILPIQRKELKTRIVTLEYVIHYLDSKLER